MKYENVLAACLDRIRTGESIEALVAEHPRYAERLRFDLTTAASARSLSARLPATSDDSRLRFIRDLQSERRSAAATPAKPHRRWFGWRLGLPAIAATAAALLVVAVLVTGIVTPTNTAEASIEGVIVDNDGSTLTLQTETGLQTVSVEQARVSCDDTSSCIGPGQLEPGQLISISGKRQASTVVARRIELRGYEEISKWCDRYPGQCAELENALSQRAERCDQNAAACLQLRSRLQHLRSEIASRTQIGDLRNRCADGTSAACNELQRRCNDSDRPICAGIRDFLRKRAQ
jgi:hypothetical protein